MLLQGSIKSRSLNRKTHVSVILPTDNIHFLSGEQEKVKKPYKTVYLLHSLFGNDETFLTNTKIQKIAEKYNLAIVLPCGENSYFLDNPTINANFATYVSKELVNLTREIFPLSQKREDTYIAGFSMGGYGAIRNGFKYSETFSKVGAFAPALLNEFVFNLKISNPSLNNAQEYSKSAFEPLDKITGTSKDPKFLLDNLLKENKAIPEIFLICGRDDMLVDLSLDFNSYLNNNKIKNNFLLMEGEHNWDFAEKALYEFIKWVIK